MAQPLDDAKAKLASGDVQEALNAAKSAVKAFVVDKDQSGEAAAWVLIMEGKFASGAYQSGVTSGNAALALFGDIGDDAGMASTLAKIATAHVEHQQSVPALAAGLKAMKLFKQMDNFEMQVNTLDTVVKAHIQNGSADAAVSVATNLVASLKKHGMSGKVLGLATKSLWLALASKGSSEAAEVEAEAMAIFQKAGEKRLEAQMLVEVASIQSSARNFAEAKTAGEAANKLFSDLKDKDGQTQVLKVLEQNEEKTKEEPERLKECEEEKSTSMAAERSVLIELIEAFRERNKDAFNKAFWKLQDSKYLTQDDVNAMIWPELTFEDEFEQKITMDWIDSAIRFGNGTYLMHMQRQAIYAFTRISGMGYGPNFRQMTAAVTKYEGFDKGSMSLGSGIGVLRLHTEITEGDWEKASWWHPGLIDQGLASQMAAARTKTDFPDEMANTQFGKLPTRSMRGKPGGPPLEDFEGGCKQS